MICNHVPLRRAVYAFSMNSVRISAFAFGGILLTILALTAVGNAVQSAGVVRDPGALETPMKIGFFTLVVLLGFSAIPLIVNAVLAVQIALGNGNVPPIKAAISHSNAIIGVLWLLMAAGLAVGLPAAIRQGFFGK